MPRIYLINRADETLHLSDYLAELLRARYGARNVLRGTVARSAAEYPGAVERDLRSCDVALVVMGPRWQTNPGMDGRPWLARPDDPTRIALATALRLGMLVVPALSDGATAPPADALPPDLGQLPRIQAFPVRPQPDMHSDLMRLYQQINTKLTWRPASLPLLVVTLLGALALAALLILGTGARDGSVAVALASGFVALAFGALLAAAVSAVVLAIRRKRARWVGLIGGALVYTALSLPLPEVAALLAALGAVVALGALLRAVVLAMRGRLGRWPWPLTGLFAGLALAAPLAWIDHPLQTAFWALPAALLAFALLGPRRETAYT